MTLTADESIPISASISCREPDQYRQRLTLLHQELGIGSAYVLRPLHAEPAELVEAGPDFYGRRQQLAPTAQAAWQRMQQAAGDEGVVLHLISAFRSVDYQCELIRKKLASGQSIETILQVNAAPGLSEHHTGRAIDIGTVECPALEEEFEGTPAFAWLFQNAGRFGFVLSYPRGNSTGICYEPWHWCYHGNSEKNQQDND